MTIASWNPANRIVATAVGLLAVTSVVVGVAVMAVMQDRLRTQISGALGDRRESSSRLFVSLVELRESQMQFVATRPGLKKSLREIASGHDVARETANVRTILQSFIEVGFSGLAYVDGGGRELARAGRFTEKPMLSVRLRTALESELAWMDGFIQTARITISDGDGLLGTVIAEQSLPVLTQLMALGENLGKTGETALCFPKGDGMACFPQRFRPRPFELPLNGSDNRPLPMSHALWGESGLVEARDYRDQQVIAAYGPVGIIGLGMVVKMDAAELLGPARAALLLVLAACTLLIGGGALLMRRQVQPLATQLVRAEEDARETHLRLNLALDASRVTVWETDVRSGETVLSEAWAEFLDRPAGETRTTVAELAALVHPTEIAELRRLQRATITGENDAYSVEHRVRAASGHWKWVLSRGQVVERDPADGRAMRMMGTNLDITARKVAELRTEHLASYDTLTGAANRALFGDRVGRAIQRNRRSGGRSALMYLDIDKFKGVNDSLGHPAGDALLMEFAARLRACVRTTDTVGRLGGDEFAVLLEDLTETDAVTRVADKILEAVRQPMSADGHALVITASIGAAVFGAEAADDVEALAKRADGALYAAKAAGRDTYRLAA